MVSSLVGLAAGWSASIDAGLPTISARLDGASVLKALRSIAKHNGLHFRLGSTRQSLVFGFVALALASNLLDAGAMVNPRVAWLYQLMLLLLTLLGAPTAYSWAKETGLVRSATAENAPEPRDDPYQTARLDK